MLVGRESNVQSSDQALSAASLPSPITWFSCAVLKEPSLLFWFSAKNPCKAMSVNSDPILGHFSVSLTIFFCQAPSAVDKIVPLVDTLLMALQVILFTRWVKHAASLHRILVTLETWSTWFNWCNCCNLQHIGETKRLLKDRFNEHRRAVDKTKPMTTEHFLSHSNHSHTDMQLMPLEKIHSSRDSVRKARESHLIDKAMTLEPHGLNRRDELL